MHVTSAGETPVEVEAKLHASRRAFQTLDAQEEIDGWRVVSRRDVQLRDTYWDTPDQRLAHAGCTLRVRELGGEGVTHGTHVAELTLKGPVPRQAHLGPSVTWTRTEVTVPVPAGSSPKEWQALPAARPVVVALRRLDAADGLRPDLVLLNPRRELHLRKDETEAVLSLDEVRLEGQPYRRRYVEVELHRGSQEALDTLVKLLVQQFHLRPSRQAKVAAARAWLQRRTRAVTL